MSVLNRSKSRIYSINSGFFLFLPLLFIFLSCATSSSVRAIKDENPAREKPVSFLSVENVQPQWQPFSQAILYFHGKTSNPRLEFWALRIELSVSDASAITRIVVRDGGHNADGTQPLSAKVSSFVRDNSLIAGINAVPFDVSSSKEGQSIKNAGIVISGGQVLSPANKRYDALVFYKDGRARIVSQSAIQSTENIENAVGAFHHILIDGEPAERTQNREIRYPRSAAGVSDNGDVLYLLVIDGRRFGSIGATEKETALLLKALGSWNGLNLDGGGSSALALRQNDGAVKIVNTPIHDGIPGQERAVAGCLGIGN